MIAADLSRGPLQWAPAKWFGAEYQLRQGETVGGTLVRRWSWAVTTSTVTVGDEHWVVRRQGFWSRRLLIEQEQTRSQVATFIPRWWGRRGELTITRSGRRLLWDSESMWGSRWLFRTLEGFSVVRFHRRFSWLRRAYEVEVDHAHSRDPDIPLLLGLGLALMLDQEASGQSGAAAG